MADSKLTELPQGLEGYIDTWLDLNPKFQYGASFYVPVWPLLRRPLANYQIGLPSTWFYPNNENFKGALCPKGTTAGEWTDRGPYFRDVFQTIEGGLGNWIGLSFPTAAPKYKIVATPSCYNFGIATPGFGFAQTPLPSADMGLAQLSNRFVIPPDGITFAKDTNGQVLGNAWMPLPLMPQEHTKPATGNQSWTLFLNAKNFSGPLAFFIPSFWSKLSQTYPSIAGRGFDARPGIMDTIGMEVNSVPLFEAQDSKGTTYSKIPALWFPVDANGNTVLAHTVNFYSQDAFFNPLKQALSANTSLPQKFGTSASQMLSPSCSLDPLSFTQGSKTMQVTGLDKKVTTTNLNPNGPCQLALKWTGIKNTTTKFPQYFKEVDGKREVVDIANVPAETNLRPQRFAPASIGANFTTAVPLSKDTTWNKYVKTQPVFNTTLNDGSVLAYRWYKFIDQPSMQHLNLNIAQRTKLQNTVLKIHKQWPSNISFMPPNSMGDLVSIDPGLLVTPPKGLEYGYVPIAIGQSSAPQTASAMNVASSAKTQLFQYSPVQLPAKETTTQQTSKARLRI